MNGYSHHAGAFDGWLRADTARVAETVRNDFAMLFAILDRQLTNWSEAAGQTHLHIAEAKSAAMRGIDLSSQLVESLRSPN
jgi:hypothetical protein